MGSDDVLGPARQLARDGLVLGIWDTARNRLGLDPGDSHFLVRTFPRYDRKRLLQLLSRHVLFFVGISPKPFLRLTLAERAFPTCAFQHC
jgi:hypothetical protein